MIFFFKKLVMKDKLKIYNFPNMKTDGYITCNLHFTASWQVVRLLWRKSGWM